MTKNRPSNKLTLIFDADNDLLAAAVLWKYHLHLPSYYHFAQAIEKYLKVLLIDTDQEYKNDHLPKNSAGNPYIPHWGHNLKELALRLPNEEKYNFYKKDKIKHLEEYSKYNESTRYLILGTPKKKEGNLSSEKIREKDQKKVVKSYTSKELSHIQELIYRLRNDIEIELDDYPLGMAIRGHHQEHPDEKTNFEYWGGIKKSAEILKEIFSNADEFVRWKKSN